MVGDRIAKSTVIPEPLDGLTIELEGHEPQIVEVGQGADVVLETLIGYVAEDLYRTFYGDVAAGVEGPLERTHT